MICRFRSTSQPNSDWNCAANGCRPLLVLTDELTITGDEDSELLLNGLLIAGRGLSVPAADEVPAANNASQPAAAEPLYAGAGMGTERRRSAARNRPSQPDRPNGWRESRTGSLHRRQPTRRVRWRTSRSMTASSTPRANTELAYADHDGTQPGAPLQIVASTVIGRVHTAALELASNTIFFSERAAGGVLPEPVFSARKQIGCVRFSFLPAGSRVPRRFHCQPDLAIEQAIDAAQRSKPKRSSIEREPIATRIRAWLKPSFTALRYGQPGYGQLRTSAPVEIRTGADDESEMGAFHELHQPQRENNLRVRLDEYLRVGLEAGIFYAT